MRTRHHERAAIFGSTVSEVTDVDRALGVAQVSGVIIGRACESPIFGVTGANYFNRAGKSLIAANVRVLRLTHPETK